MESRFNGARCAWGEPTIKIGDTVLETLRGFTQLTADNDVDDGGDVPFWVDDHEYSLSFDVELDKATIRSIRRMFVFRIPRKKKKKFKTFLSKRFGIKTKKLLFNNQIRRKRYDKGKFHK